MSSGLSVSRLVSVEVFLSPIAAQSANLNTCLIVGDSDVINTGQRILSFNSLDDVADLFSTTDPEYKAAALFFAQVPQPTQLYIGRWASSDTAGQLICGAQSAAEQVISNWTTVTAGEFKIAVDGGSTTNVTCGSFAAASNLNAVATIIQTAVQALGGAYADVTVVWNGTQFVFTSGTTGAGSAVAALTTGTASDISAKLKGTASTLSSIVDGIDAETPLEAITILNDNGFYWYGCTFAATASISNSDYIDVAGFIEASGNPHMLGITSTDAACADPASTTDIAYLAKVGGYNRTFVQYSDNPYAAASFWGRAVTVNFNGTNTMISMMYKVEPGVVPQYLSPTGADALQTKNANVFVFYDNDTAIIQYGNVASGAWFDEIFGLDWLRLAIQTAVFNLLYTSFTKIPQTDAGNHQIANTITGVLNQGVTNGLIAPGQWNSSMEFGQLSTGDYLPTGYYVYTPPITSQSQADREARRSVAFQVAVKLAGAINTADCAIFVNR